MVTEAKKDRALEKITVNTSTRNKNNTTSLPSSPKPTPLRPLMFRFTPAPPFQQTFFLERTIKRKEERPQSGAY
jgi:hypothetical protein